MVEARDRSRRLLASPEAAAERAGTFVVADPAAGRIESLLLHVEARALAAADRLGDDAFPPTGEDRAHLALFVALLLLRGRAHRAGVEALAGHLVQAVAERSGEADEAGPSLVVEAVPGPDEPSRLVLSAVPELARLLAARTWQLVAFARPIVLTGDTPAVLWTRSRTPMPFGIRLGLADEVRVPIGSRHALILARHAPAGEVVRELGDRHAAALNRTVAEAAQAWMYYHPGADPMEAVELPSV
jgi:hypothetical protein